MRKVIFKKMVIMRLMLKKYFFIFFFLIPSLSYADSISVAVKNRTNHQLEDSIKFGEITNSIKNKYILSPNYLQLSYTNDNPQDWVIQIYTINGGLVLPDKSSRVPFFWQVYTNTNNNITFDSSSNWGEVIDKNDDEWFNSAYLSHRFIATNGVLGKFPFPGLKAESPLYIYTGGNFKTVKAGSYSTDLFLDILPFSYFSLKPGITFDPKKHPDEINIIGDKFVVYANINDQDKLFQVNFYYKRCSKKLYNKKTHTPGSSSYYLIEEIPSSDVTLDGIEYYVEAIDNQRNVIFSDVSTIKVKPSKTETIGPNGGDIELIDGNPQDGSMKVSIPKAALAVNKEITIRQIYNEDDMILGNGIVNGQIPLAVYECSPPLNFDKMAQINLLYFDLNNNGKVEKVNGIETDVNEETLGIFWWDGFDYCYLGGKVDTVKNIVSASVSHLSTFALFSATGLTKEAFRPKERIATPNGDGINDIIHFGGEAGQLDITILDVTGRVIRHITDVPEWDGKDANGNYVESGVYIYQVKLYINGKRELMSGTIAIAK